ncbi:MAG: acetate kinase [Candidatus Omnitrophica bacterium]|nr:acetate kinase [Candidatus Omnitrophota bacterium]
MLILVINCGSSSAKYDLFDITKGSSDIGRGVVERIGEEVSILRYTSKGNPEVETEVRCFDHHGAIEIIKETLMDKEIGVLNDLKDVAGVGHRVVHGGEEFNKSTTITDEVIESIEKFSELAPLHNPPSLEGIRSCMKILEGVPQVAVFDTAFHQTMEERTFCYGVPYELYKKYGIRRYGFHGTSHRFVSLKAAEVLGKPVSDVNVITAHLGNGCSMAAIRGGKSVDTSMGFTPLEGLLMGTRSGDIDPAVVTFLMQRENLGPEEINDLLNKKSGLLGVSGISNDMRDILKARKEGNKRAKLAYDMFVYRIKKYIGAYTAVLGSVDAVVFTAGIGEKVAEIRDSIEKDLRFLSAGGTEFLTISTNEEFLIAQDTYKIVNDITNGGEGSAIKGIAAWINKIKFLIRKKQNKDK